MQSIINDIKREFTFGNKITRLILINVIVFVGLSLFKVFFRFAGSDAGSLFADVMRYLSLSDSFVFNITHPWVFITSIFLHIDFWHILWNMLFLYWFGKVVGDLAGDKHVYPIYFYGGIAGGLAFILTAGLFGYIQAESAIAYGASGAVMAFVLAAGVLAPDYIFHLILIGPVRLKYIVMVVVLLDIIGLGNNINTGGHFAHLGGAAMGWFYIWSLRNGINLVPDWLMVMTVKQEKQPKKGRIIKMERVISSIKKSSSGSSNTDEDKVMTDSEKEVDRILDKINKSGIDSLTDVEKETLYRASNKK